MTPTIRMAPEDRQTQILDAVLPVVLASGSGVTSRQLAEAAGVAEGTLYRSFGDKETLLAALLARETHAAFHLPAGALDGAGTIDEVVTLIVTSLTARFAAYTRLLVALGPSAMPSDEGPQLAFELLRSDLTAALEPFAADLRVSPVVAADVIRTLGFSAASEWGGERVLEMSDVIGILLRGIAHPDLAVTTPTVTTMQKER